MGGAAIRPADKVLRFRCSGASLTAMHFPREGRALPQAPHAQRPHFRVILTQFRAGAGLAPESDG